MKDYTVHLLVSVDFAASYTIQADSAEEAEAKAEKQAKESVPLEVYSESWDRYNDVSVSLISIEE